MKFFIDTADIAEIRDLAATGMVDGITTNPSLVAKSGRDFFEVLKEICEVVPGPVSAEVTAVDFEGMLNEGRALAKQIGRASCRERVCQYSVDLGGRRIIKKKNTVINTPMHTKTGFTTVSTLVH